MAVLNEFFDIRLTPFAGLTFERCIGRVADERSNIQPGLVRDKTLKLGKPKEIAECLLHVVVRAVECSEHKRVVTPDSEAEMTQTRLAQCPCGIRCRGYSFLTSRNFTNAYTYDAASNRTGFTDPESGSTTYSYDTLNRLTTLAPPSAFTTGSFGFSYDALSRRTQMTRPNSIATNYTYDNLSRLLTVLHQAGGSTIDGASYTVDSTGNRTAKTDQLAAVTSNYTYDAIYQLLSATQGGSTSESYTYNPVGNRTASLGVSSYTTNASNELTATSNASYTYDSNGNTLTKTVGSDTTSYTWDFENRLTSVTLPGSGGTVSFKYDPFGRRIYKSPSGGTSIFAYDGASLVEETNGAGAVAARYAQGASIDEPLAMLRSSSTSYYNADGLGSVTSLANATGTLVQTYTFDSFGKLTASAGSLTNPFQYTGRESDPETGLYSYRARYYDTSIGRFLSEDPTQLRGGINFYAYVKNGPVDFVDPWGLQCKQVTPWHAIPRWSNPNGRKPYTTIEDGFFFNFQGWDFMNSLLIDCDCTWASTHTRIRKFYREDIKEEAWFECPTCNGQTQREYRTRDKIRVREEDSAGQQFMPPVIKHTPGKLVQIGPDGGTDPNRTNVNCLCSPPTP